MISTTGLEQLNNHRDIWLEIANEMKVSETGQKSLLKILMHKYAEEFVSDQVDGCVCRYKTFLNQSKDVQNDHNRKQIVTIFVIAKSAEAVSLRSCRARAKQ